METGRIVESIGRLFREEGHRIVFWQEPEVEFADVVDEIAASLGGPHLLRLDRVGPLAAKIAVEIDRPDDSFLIYAPVPTPDEEEDWLLDIRTYAGRFSADRASMALAEVGLGGRLALRDHAAKRMRFLASKERIAKLARLVDGSENAEVLDLKMMAVVSKADRPEAFPVVQAVLDAYAREGSLDSMPQAWADMERFDLGASFWETVSKTFGYADETPTLRRFAIRLFATDLAKAVRKPLRAVSHLILPGAGAANTLVFLNQWRDSASRGESYDTLSALVAETMETPSLLAGLELEDLADCMTFLDVEKAFASRLRRRIVETSQHPDPEGVRNLAGCRLNGHWASPSRPASASVPRTAFASTYRAMISAAELFALWAEHRNKLGYASPAEMWRAYEGELSGFDTLYRRFCLAADDAEAEGWDILKDLRDAVEGIYTNGWLAALSLKWGGFVENGLLKAWKVEGVRNQQTFFAGHVSWVLEKGENRKAFVIVSDAFRYEAAKELVAELNGRYRIQAELSSMLGVLPSYTGLGMAALLPHSKLSYSDGGDAQVDGKAAGNLAARSKVLESVGGAAVSAGDLMKMRKDEGRDFLRELRVVYIYHNVIDAMGDSRSTEHDTFRAVRQAIDEIAKLIGRIVNDFNGAYVLVTADHGFLFTEGHPGESDRSELGEKPAGAFKAKKRYVLGRGMPPLPNVWSGSVTDTAAAEGNVGFHVPKGTTLFHFSGGARFVHGGAMLQEVMVPVATVKLVKGKGKEETRPRRAAVHVLGTNHRVTTNRHGFDLLQTEAVDERVHPHMLNVFVEDEAGNAVSDVVTVTFDSSSSDIDERKKRVRLTLKAGLAGLKGMHTLVLRDTDGQDHQRVPVMIDLAFSNDF